MTGTPRGSGKSFCLNCFCSNKTKFFEKTSARFFNAATNNALLSNSWSISWRVWVRVPAQGIFPAYGTDVNSFGKIIIWLRVNSYQIILVLSSSDFLAITSWPPLARLDPLEPFRTRVLRKSQKLVLFSFLFHLGKSLSKISESNETKKIPSDKPTCKSNWSWVLRLLSSGKAVSSAKKPKPNVVLMLLY